MAIQSLQDLFPVAHELARQLGHELGRFDQCGMHGASAECLRPGCNMGLTVRDDGGPDIPFTIIGSAAVHSCTGSAS